MEKFSQRLVFFALLILIFLGTILYRLVDLQILHGDRYERFSQINTFREIRIPAPRGLILDRHGEILAENRPVFVLTLDLSQVNDLKRSLATLGFLLGVGEEEIRPSLGEGKKIPNLSPIVIAEDLDREQVAKIRARMTPVQLGLFPDFELNGITLTTRYLRVYPKGNGLGHLLGYLRQISPENLKRWEEKYPHRVAPGDQEGIQGVERAFDETLRGYDGLRRFFVDAAGRKVDGTDLGLEEFFEEIPFRRGEDLQLTVDVELNSVAVEAFGERIGALVALDPQTGEILAWVSQPSLDPQTMGGTLSPSMWQEIRDHPDNVLLNRPIQAAYPPGSIHKIVTAVAALAEGKVNFSEKIRCPGYFQSGNRRFGCWNKSGHGSMDLHHAIQQSCDVFFYRLGERLGPDRLAKYARMLGLGEKTGVLKDTERSGLVPTAAWKEEQRKSPWIHSDNLGNAIGQGFNLVTPLQSALMMAQVANGGKKLKPHLFLSSGKNSARFGGKENNFVEELPLNLASEDYLRLKQALVDVVEGRGGTGRGAHIPGIRVGGKTGTAQVVALERKGRGAHTEDHAWFVAFAPADNPTIALAVVVEHGGSGGSVAAPIAKRVLEKFFEHRTCLGCIGGIPSAAVESPQAHPSKTTPRSNLF